MATCFHVFADFVHARAGIAEQVRYFDECFDTSFVAICRRSHRVAAEIKRRRRGSDVVLPPSGSIVRPVYTVKRLTEISV